MLFSTESMMLMLRKGAVSHSTTNNSTKHCSNLVTEKAAQNQNIL